MEQCGAERVEIAALGDKCQITAILAGTLTGELLPLQVIYTGKSERCHPIFSFPDGFDVWHMPNHRANEESTLRFVENIVNPHIEEVRSKKETSEQHAVFKGQIGDRVQTLLEDNKIMRVLVPSNCTDPLDLSTK